MQYEYFGSYSTVCFCFQTLQGSVCRPSALCVQHYSSIMSTMFRNSLLAAVSMSRPSILTPLHDSLSAFWPSLQVLAGDLRPAIETHEAHTLVARKYYGFLPEVRHANGNSYGGLRE